MIFGKNRELARLEIAKVRMYRRVFFDTDDGLEVLKDILNDLGHFMARLEDDEDRILHNAAQVILAKLGVMTFDQIDEYMGAISHMIEPDQRVKEKENE